MDFSRRRLSKVTTSWHGDFVANGSMDELSSSKSGFNGSCTHRYGCNPRLVQVKRIVQIDLCLDYVKNFNHNDIPQSNCVLGISTCVNKTNYSRSQTPRFQHDVYVFSLPSVTEFICPSRQDAVHLDVRWGG